VKKLLGFFALAICATTFLGAATVTVTKPTTGDVWAQGQTHAVTWTKTGAMGNLVRVSLRDKNSAAEIKLIADNVPNTGTTQWTIAADIADGQYRVRVKVKNETTQDDSEVFTIGPPPSQASITVTKPAAGDTWHKTKPYTITWTKSGTMPSSVKIDLVDKDSAAVVRPIADNQPNTGAYLWTIPEDVAIGPCRVRVQVKTTTIQDDSETFAIGYLPVSVQPSTAKFTSKTYTVPTNDVWNLTTWRIPGGGGYVPDSVVPFFQARLTCLKQVATAQELKITAQVGGDHFTLSGPGGAYSATAASRARVLFDVTPFMGKGADIIEAKMHLTQTRSVRSNTSQASCGMGWWFMLTYPVDSPAGWQNPPIDMSCHGDLSWSETDYSVDVTPAVKRWVSGNQFNYGLLLIGTDELIDSNVHTCYSCFKAELIIKLKVE
jgi:hypothetical protein